VSLRVESGEFVAILEIMEIFQRLNEERLLTILLVTHEPDISRFARRIVVFRDGRVRNDLPVAEPTSAARMLSTVPAADEDEELAETGA
jgi:putative ABC transport system ATP-binding protein